MINEPQWERYWNYRRQNFSMMAAAKKVGISYASAKAKERGLRDSSGKAWKEAKLAKPKYLGAVPLDELKPEAKRALDDFAYFRLRYFGRLSTPWQEDEAYKVLEFMATGRKEFVVVNAPPGSGKSTVNTLDIPVWLTCRNRSLRGLIGSASQDLAERYLDRIRNHLEMTWPVLAEDDQKELGLAVDAEATLVGDFGLFKPAGIGHWSKKALTVAQHGDRSVTEKEPTWSAYGLDTSFIGGRYGICLWDDLVEEKHVASLESIDKQRSRWDKVAEKRLEPGGTHVLQGQRLSPEDLYRYNIDKRAGASDTHEHTCCEAEPDAKYHLLVYRAHWEDRCENNHGDDSPYWPEGCLLDPRRLPWRELEAEMENGLSNYLQVYQQEDADPSLTLVNALWVSGGTDPVTKEYFPGCWDNDRDLCELPPGVVNPISICSTDPSPTMKWSNQWWAFTNDHPQSWLLDLHGGRMSTAEFLDWNNPRQEFTGLMEQWWQRSVELNMRITHWIIEANSANNYIFGTSHFNEWAASRGVQIIAHVTGRNKADPKYGIQMLAPLYQHGLVRLPGKQMTKARFTSLKLVDEVQKWPKGRYDDGVLAQWFFEHNRERGVVGAKSAVGKKLWRPAFMKRPA